jgi:hypothetical protein
VRAPRFVTGHCAAFLGRDRGARSVAAPLCIAFEDVEYFFLVEDAKEAVHTWLSYAAYHADDALQRSSH